MTSDMICDHRSSKLYFNASIAASEECRFKAFKCEKWDDYVNGKCNNNQTVQMGYYSIRTTKEKATNNKYYLKTTDEYPFCPTIYINSNFLFF